MFIRGTTIPDPLTINKALPATWIATFPHFAPTVVEGLRDVETVDMPGDYACDEEKRVD